MQNIHLPLYRGFTDAVSTGIYSNPYVDMPRRPRDSGQDEHDQADQWFLQQFGVRYRSSTLFATGKREIAENYGKVFIIEPEDETACKCCWSPIYPDLYHVLHNPNFAHLEICERLNKGDYREFPWSDESYRKYAAKSGHEVMLFAPTFKLSNINK